MTKNEAFNILEPIMFFDKEKDEALHIAIKALKQTDELERENEFLKNMQRALTKEMSLEELGFILTMERRK